MENDDSTQNGYFTYIGLVPRTKHLKNYQYYKTPIISKIRKVCGLKHVKCCDITATDFYVALTLKLPFSLKHYSLVAMLKRGTSKTVRELNALILHAGESLWYEKYVSCYTILEIKDAFIQKVGEYAESRHGDSAQAQGCEEAQQEIS